MYPVPMTMQTFAALLVGGLLGARMASIAVSVWLLQGIAGLPVFSGGGAGVGHFFWSDRRVPRCIRSDGLPCGGSMRTGDNCRH